MNYPNFIPLTSHKTTVFICEWGNCGYQPVSYVIFGCLEQDVDEIILCRQHHEIWTSTMPSLRCPCGEPVDMATHVHVSNLHKTWLDTLLRDQNARRAGKYLSGVGVPTTINTRVSKPVLPSVGGVVGPAVFTPNGVMPLVRGSMIDLYKKMAGENEP